MLTSALAAIFLGPLQPVPAPVMRVHCIDVRQGSAALFEFKCGAVLIDGGADSTQNASVVADYLDKFFERRTDLNKTLKAVFLTHVHVDHTRGLPLVFERFKVEKLVTNGPSDPYASGAKDMRKVFAMIKTSPVKVREVYDDEVASKLPKGVTDRDIDPVRCADCDPRIRVLSGRLPEDPGWGNEYGKPRWKNENNNSLVIKIDFKGSSTLITGDMEDVAIERMIESYHGSKALDSDVYFAGHHGSKNGTTRELVKAVSPKLALVSCGHYDDGKDPQRSFTTWAYGHPNKGILDYLQEGIKAKRDQPIQVYVGKGGKKFEPGYNVVKAVYCTAWDKDIVFESAGSGKFTRVP